MKFDVVLNCYHDCRISDIGIEFHILIDDTSALKSVLSLRRRLDCPFSVRNISILPNSSFAIKEVAECQSICL